MEMGQQARLPAEMLAHSLSIENPHLFVKFDLHSLVETLNLVGGRFFPWKAKTPSSCSYVFLCSYNTTAI
jgi:hypothetical protein